MTPNEYITVARRLLHDPDAKYWTDTTTVLAWAREAIQERDRATACRRELITKALVAGTDLYTFAGLSNERVFDVINIYLLNGDTRIRLDQMSFTKLNETVRRSATMRRQPFGWTRYGAASVYLAPIPDIVYTTYWDCCTFAADDLGADTDDDIPYPYTQPVAYYIAYLAKTNEREYDEADEFLNRFNTECGNINGFRSGMTPVSGR